MYITLAYVMRCTEMFTNNERCPYAPIASQDVACFDSVFPEDFYYQSPDTICEYELLILISGWQNCKSSGIFLKSQNSKLTDATTCCFSLIDTNYTEVSLF